MKSKLTAEHIVMISHILQRRTRDAALAFGGDEHDVACLLMTAAAKQAILHDRVDREIFLEMAGGMFDAASKL